MSGEDTTATPGEFIRERLESLGWTQADLAFVLGVTTATVNQLVNGRRNLSPTMAKAIGAAVRIKPATLVRLQAARDLDGADEPNPMVFERARIASVYPLRDMLKRGWIDEADSPDGMTRAVTRFFGVDSLDDVPHLTHAARRTPVEAIPAAQLAWLFRVRQIAKEMPTPKYSRRRFLNAIDEMRGYLGNREETRHVPVLLREAGVRYILVECLPGSKIDGVCFWLDPDSPVIGMSMRFNRVDNFWFVLRHECAHVLHGHGKKVAVVDLSLDEFELDDREEERIANSEAADFCIPRERMDSFYKRKYPFFSERDVLAFSKILKVHPGLVVGQLQKRLDRYNFLRHHLVPVFDQIEDGAMVDGWGHFVPVE